MTMGRFVAKSLVHGAIELSGWPRMRRAKGCGKLIVLTYHSFNLGGQNGLVHSLPLNRFEKQLRFLKENFYLVSLTDGVAALERRDTADKPWLAITIDDGFRDNYEYAFPLLQKYGVPATIFLATDFLDEGVPPWPTRLAEMLESTRRLAVSSPFDYRLESWESRAELSRNLKVLYANLAPSDRLEALQELQQHLGVETQTKYPPLSWDQVREMKNKGIEFGSHTVYHSILPAVSHRVLLQELADSKARLETELEEPCVLFAYPDGKHSKATSVALQESGYRIAVTQDYGWNSPTTNRLSMQRIEVPFHDPLPTFRCRVSTALQRT